MHKRLYLLPIPHHVSDEDTVLTCYTPSPFLLFLAFIEETKNATHFKPIDTSFVLFFGCSGESMENALRACCKGIKIGKILIHREGDNGQQAS